MRLRGGQASVSHDDTFAPSGGSANHCRGGGEGGLEIGSSVIPCGREGERSEHLRGSRAPAPHRLAVVAPPPPSSPSRHRHNDTTSSLCHFLLLLLDAGHRPCPCHPRLASPWQRRTKRHIANQFQPYFTTWGPINRRAERHSYWLPNRPHQVPNHLNATRRTRAGGVRSRAVVLPFANAQLPHLLRSIGRTTRARQGHHQFTHLSPRRTTGRKRKRNLASGSSRHNDSPPFGRPRRSHDRSQRGEMIPAGFVCEWRTRFCDRIGPTMHQRNNAVDSDRQHGKRQLEHINRH
uniref:p0432B10.12 protein n=1 Tax=Oryza sativa subsp. japonica TaxID=39947 RepID=Q7F2H6_ORYSJ|nr:P0432B10.12 [Oryza sativa Japonica Group]